MRLKVEDPGLNVTRAFALDAGGLSEVGMAVGRAACGEGQVGAESQGKRLWRRTGIQSGAGGRGQRSAAFTATVSN